MQWLGVLALSVVGHGFRGSNQTLKYIFAASLLSTDVQWVKAKTVCLEIKIMCLSGATCLPTYVCFSKLALHMYIKDPIKGIGLVQSGLHPHGIKK